MNDREQEWSDCETASQRIDHSINNNFNFDGLPCPQCKETIAYTCQCSLYGHRKQVRPGKRVGLLESLKKFLFDN